jgi:hypothetical protein
MTQDEIEHMWKIASNDPNHDTNWHDPVVIAFAKLVAAKEREACMKACEKTITSQRSAWGANFCIEAIKARGQA